MWQEQVVIKMASAFRQFSKSRKGKFVLTGIPFVASVIGGSYFLATVKLFQLTLYYGIISFSHVNSFLNCIVYNALLGCSSLSHRQTSMTREPFLKVSANTTWKRSTRVSWHNWRSMTTNSAGFLGQKTKRRHHQPSIRKNEWQPDHCIVDIVSCMYTFPA